MLFKREPAMILATAQAGIALLAGCGLQISTDQQGLILGFLGAVLALATGTAIRSRVTPAGPLD